MSGAIVDQRELPLCALLRGELATIREEVARVPAAAFVPWPDRGAYAGDWRILPFTFRVAEPPASFDFAGNARLCPRLAALLVDRPRVLAAGISRLMPGCEIRPHHDLPRAGVLRFHLPLTTSRDAALVLDGRVLTASPDHAVLFDQSLEHAAYNRGPNPRDALIVDYDLEPAAAARVAARRGAVNLGPTLPHPHAP